MVNLEVGLEEFLKAINKINLSGKLDRCIIYYILLSVKLDGDLVKALKMEKFAETTVEEFHAERGKI